eukprot:gene52551-6013_t
MERQVQEWPVHVLLRAAGGSGVGSAWRILSGLITPLLESGSDSDEASGSPGVSPRRPASPDGSPSRPTSATRAQPPAATGALRTAPRRAQVTLTEFLTAAAAHAAPDVSCWMAADTEHMRFMCVGGVSSFVLVTGRPRSGQPTAEGVIADHRKAEELLRRRREEDHAAQQATLTLGLSKKKSQRRRKRAAAPPELSTGWERPDTPKSATLPVQDGPRDPQGDASALRTATVTLSR